VSGEHVDGTGIDATDFGPFRGVGGICRGGEAFKSAVSDGVIEIEEGFFVVEGHGKDEFMDGAEGHTGTGGKEGAELLNAGAGNRVVVIVGG